MASLTLAQLMRFLPAARSETRAGEKPDVTLHGVSAVSDAAAGTLSFLTAKTKEPKAVVAKTKAAVIIVEKDAAVVIEDAAPDVKAFLRIEGARLAFIRAATEFFAPAPRVGVHPTAVISPEVKLGKNIFIGAHCVIEGDITIADNVQILPGTMIWGHVTIGKGSYIGPNCSLGVEGFGFQRASEGALEKFPHYGGITIEEDVFIGANTCVARGTLGNTLIKRGAKIDNLVHVAHNVIVGEDAFVVANSMLGGSVIIGDRAWIAPSATLINKVTVGNDATVGIATLVLKDVEPGAVMVGVPAKRIR